MNSNGEPNSVRRSDALPCQFDLMDRHVFPVGIIPGQQILLAGEPGSGKSTLMLQTLLGFARTGVRCVYAASEEEPGETRRRLEQLRLNEGALRVEVYAAKSPEDAFLMPYAKPDRGPVQVLIIDSLQGLGFTSWSREPWNDLHHFMEKMREAKITVFYVAHVTKNVKIAGPKRTEHDVDTTVTFATALSHRLIRVPKNRKGPSIEEPILCRKDRVGRLSAMLRASTALVGQATAFDDDGLLNVEAKVEFAASIPGRPRKPALTGVTKNAYAKIASVLRGMGVDLGHLTVSCSLPGGRRYQPEQDLAIAMALLASYLQTPIPYRPVFCGELSLGGRVLEAPITVLRQLIREYKRDDFAAANRTFIFEHESMQFIYKELRPLPILPVSVLDFKGLPEVASEFLLEQDLPPGWQGE